MRWTKTMIRIITLIRLIRKRTTGRMAGRILRTITIISIYEQYNNNNNNLTAIKRITIISITTK